MSILTQPSPYLCENIDIVVTVCVFSNTIQYFLLQTVLDFDAGELPHEFIYVDEAGFNLAKTRHRGRNVIGQRAVVNVPGQRGGNITLCAAISVQGVLHNHATLGPYNTGQIIAFLDALHAVVQDRPQQPRFVVIWDNVSFHRAALVRDWFNNHNHFTLLYLPPYRPFLNTIEEFFSAWWWKVYDRQPHARMTLLQAMEETCGDIEVGSIQGWIRHTRQYFPRCLACEDITCDVDKVLWPDPNRMWHPKAPQPPTTHTCTHTHTHTKQVNVFFFPNTNLSSNCFIFVLLFCC